MSGRRNQNHYYQDSYSYKNKSYQRAQTSLAKAAHYLRIAQISDLQGQHGDPDYPKI